MGFVVSASSEAVLRFAQGEGWGDAAMTTTRDSFVGRAEQRRSIADHFAGAAAGAGARVAYVDGPAGIGKTSLTEQVARDWSDSGGVVRWSRCWNGPGTPPLWPWTQIVGDERNLHEGAPVSADARSGELARFEQFTAVVGHLNDHGRDGALLVVIDDVHWADAATVELLDFVMRDPRASEVRILVTSRTPEASLVDHQRALVDIATQAHRVTLGGLAVDEVAELASRFGTTRDDAQRVFERTDGNPLFVTELFRLAQLEVDLADAVPSSVGAVIGRHLDQLGPEVQRVLQRAAVQGQTFDVDVLAVAGQHDRDELDVILDEARRYQLIQRRAGSWAFRHALVGDALLEGASIEQCWSDHLATADAIEKIHGPDRDDLAGTVCSHLVSSGSRCPPQRVLDTARRAAEHAGAQLAWTSQAHFLGVAVDAIRSAHGSDRELAELLIEQCTAEKSARSLDGAAATGVELARLARSIGDPVLLARAALVYPPDSEGIEIDEIHAPDQVLLRTEALASLPEDQTELRIELRGALALSMYWETSMGDRGESHVRSSARRDELTRSALDEARALNNPSVLAAALDARIHATWGPATAAERPRLAEELYAVASELGDARRVLVARVWRIAELLETWQFGEADREIAAFESDAHRINDRVGIWTALRWRANRAFMTGDLDVAEAIAGEALGCALEFMPEHVSMSFYITMMGPIHYLQGCLGDDLDTVMAIAEESPEVPAWKVGTAAALSEVGDLAAARERLQQLAADDFAMLPRDLNFFGAMIMLSLVSLNVGDARVAAAIRPHLEERMGRYAQHGTGYTSYGPVDLAIAQCAHASGDADAAEHHYRVAIERGDEVGTPYADAARLHLGWLLLDRDHAGARRMLNEAVERFEACGLSEMAGRAAALLFRLEGDRTISFSEHDAGWRLTPSSGKPLELGDLKGLRVLRELLLSPRVSHHALDLARVLERDTSNDLRPNDLPIERLDDDAVRAYRQRVEELRVSLDRADRRGDVAASRRLQAELDALLEQLADGEGFGGRTAHDPTAADRARVNITKHVKRAIERVGSLDDELGEHLRSSISTGMHCAYEPAADTAHRWTT